MNTARAMLALWVVGTAVTGSLAWTAVAVAGAGGTPDVVHPLTTSEVTALATANPVVDTGAGPDDPGQIGRGRTAEIGFASALPGTFHIDAGSVGVRRDGENVQFVWATPNTGYHAEVESYGPDAVVVEFEQGESELSLRISVIDGELVGQIDDGDTVGPSTTVAGTSDVTTTSIVVDPATPPPITTDPTTSTTSTVGESDDDSDDEPGEHSDDDDAESEDEDHEDEPEDDEDGSGGDSSDDD